MQISLFTVAIMAVSGAYAATHKAAACVSNRMSSPVGGTPFSPSYNWQTTYEVLTDATNKESLRNSTIPDATGSSEVCGVSLTPNKWATYCKRKAEGWYSLEDSKAKVEAAMTSLYEKQAALVGVIYNLQQGKPGDPGESPKGSP
ncbi:hypothetical protein BFJ72_g4682 [Fusarium proliferatum]|uniref:Uncharacterized protein n=1 Tax=Gibberella intermedia TaxID=948311 RepID=A0A420TNY9_GIBIN|nr:hypothetical protein BFJ72_g4682 [Fusarium proliferatum]